MALSLKRDTRLLFIGDSITDCGRRQDKAGIGTGYVRDIRHWLLARDPANAPVVINQGISGNKVTDLARRWQRDVIDLKPDVLSIKIGVNDVWHGTGGRNDGVSIDVFVPTYRKILADLGAALPKCRLVLCEPTVLWPPQPAEGNDLLKPYVKAVNDLAGEFHAECVVPLHGAFNRARELRPDVDWAPDGAHPSPAGHMLIARTWLAATGLL